MHRFVQALTFVLLLATFASAQETTGTITGTVRDPSGAVVPGASVTVHNARTGVERRIAANSEGNYIATALPVGTYEVIVERQGFKKVTAEGIQLNVNDRLVVDVTLEVGSLAETATVLANVTVLETETATTSGLVDSKKVAELPLDGRNWAQLINLQAGVSNNNNANQGSGQFINGSRGAYNNFLLDGGDLNDPVVPSGSAAGVTGAFTGSAPGINAVSVDAVEEFRVITAGATAEFGRNSGAQINVITKSGTNNLHGTLFHFLRNRNLDARSFFDLNLAFHAPHMYGGDPLRSYGPGSNIEYPDEDPWMRQNFEQELARRGLKSEMPAECYTDYDYKWDYSEDD